MNENDRKILARACDLCWHEKYSCPICGYYNTDLFQFCYCDPPVRKSSRGRNPTFTTPDDWELVRVKIIAGPNVGAFHQWLIDHKSWLGSGFEWWLMRTPEQCCQLVCNWIKARPDLFPWVGEMEE